ncbi:AgmX/PglI C-terminal domain-containing protein [Aggregicoccus sp. 17bor-14]|uniref:AgmX/PglI C-terminal domain-containing protein n=1 Tax=Myxococcaceae TaxID=31 RepID=UPI00129C2679|nr:MULTISPECIES: AgmX/PglI C-terminal domain-containing protein [Myxococcaceae]MBF5044072.1 AgmX/PglI C-terminal domain-containing protein [Simulacricoccus sp. 17bor-14]MRI89823.1 AgmX/PglI C-terminal domain-containing protein [Aggregicoccus sp. 17bor-14]
MMAGHDSRKVAPGAGRWLYRQGELLLGPVTDAQLVEKLYAGEVSGATEVAPLGERGFRRLGDVEAFRVHVAKAEAKARVDAAERAARAQRNRKLGIAVGAGALVTLLLAGVAWRVARYAAVHGSFGEGASEAGFEDISVEPPTITLARARGPQEELVEYPDARRAGSGSSAKGASASRTGDRRPAAAGPRAMTAEGSDADGMQTAVIDQEGINRVVKAHQRTLYPCLREEAQRQPGIAIRVPIEFTVGADGRVTRLWVDNPSLKQGPLYECFLRELQKWPFQRTEGDGASVALSFNIAGRPG